MSLSMIPMSLIDSIVATALSGPSDNCDALCGWPTDMFDDTNQIGDLLLQAIIPAIRMRFGTTESVAAGEETRQSEESEPQVYHFPANTRPLTALKALAAIGAFETMAAYSGYWESSMASRFCSDLRTLLIRYLSGYTEAVDELLMIETEAA